MIAVELDHVSKRFRLHRERARSFQELFLRTVHRKQNPSSETLWALSDVSLAVERGEMVGVIGDNGAGKSTLLKLLTRIIEPTSGRVSIHGRVSALLELGAGFHPDLTGRENIYLNGSILGFSRAEMRRLFDEIVAFSQLEQFIDVPVKHYSSGMYMRLGFSIAIHVRPDILLVDEILAVGDQSFQLRCLDRISAVKRDGATVVFVSHDLNRVRSLCDWAVWLEGGRVQAQGDTAYALEQYLTQVRTEDKKTLHRAEESRRGEATNRWGTREAEIAGVQFLDEHGQEQRSFATGAPFVVRIRYDAHQRIVRPQFGLAIFHTRGFQINGPNTTLSGFEIGSIEGQGFVEHVVESLPLLEGTYLVSASLYDYEGLQAYDHHHQAYTFRVHGSEAVREKYGSIYIPSTWRMGPRSECDP